MEAIPRVPMIAPEMKVPDVPMPPDLVLKLREYIQTHYGDDPTKFNDAFNELQSMRYTVYRCQSDVESLCVMKRYYSQVSMMKNRFPMEQGEPVSVAFNWNDKSDMPCCTSYDDINFELCCVLYNIAAAHATIAMNEVRSSLESIKNAFMHFQCAAWPLQQLRDELGASRFGIAEFESGFLTFFIKILLAQAQECLIEKSMIDHRKNTVVAKLAAFASEAYFELVVLVEASSISEYISNSKLKAWKILCGAKGNLYAAISRLYLGQNSDEEKKYGERLAHYFAALNHIKDAQKLVEKDKGESLKQAIQFASDIIVQKEANARKENDFIYHERVPKSSDLSQVEAVSMVKPIGFDPCDRSVSGDDLFAALLPTNVLKGVSMYSEEKAKLMRNIREKIDKKDVELEEHLLALQLNQINLEQSTDDMRLPEELLQCSAAYTARQHSFSELLEKLASLVAKSAEAEFKLNDLKTRLEAIRCPKLENDEGYKAICLKVGDLLDHLAHAKNNNSELQKALASQSEQLKLLALPVTELAKIICDKSVNAMSTTEGMALRKMLDKVDEMKRQRMALCEALRIDLENDEITTKILAEKDFNLTVLFDNELRKHEKSLTLIEMNMAAQENILKALTESNANFAQCRKEIVENNEKRMQKSVELVTGFQVFTGVQEKTEAAGIFFGQLFALMKKLDLAVSGIEENFKDEKMKHDELKLIAERTELLNGLSNSQNSSIDTTELGGRTDGKSKLAEYIQYYRNKRLGGQNGVISQSTSNDLPTSVSPMNQLPFPYRQPNQELVAPSIHQSLNLDFVSNSSFSPNSAAPINNFQVNKPPIAPQQRFSTFESPVDQIPVSTVQPKSDFVTNSSFSPNSAAPINNFQVNKPSMAPQQHFSTFESPVKQIPISATQPTSNFVSNTSPSVNSTAPINSFQVNKPPMAPQQHFSTLESSVNQMPVSTMQPTSGFVSNFELSTNLTAPINSFQVNKPPVTPQQHFSTFESPVKQIPISTTQPTSSFVSNPSPSVNSTAPINSFQVNKPPMAPQQHYSTLESSVNQMPVSTMQPTSGFVSNSSLSTNSTVPINNFQVNKPPMAPQQHYSTFASPVNQMSISTAQPTSGFVSNSSLSTNSTAPINNFQVSKPPMAPQQHYSTFASPANQVSISTAQPTLGFVSNPSLSTNSTAPINSFQVNKPPIAPQQHFSTLESSVNQMPVSTMQPTSGFISNSSLSTNSTVPINNFQVNKPPMAPQQHYSTFASPANQMLVPHTQPNQEISKLPSQSSNISITPSPYTSLVAKKQQKKIIPKDSPWHQNLPSQFQQRPLNQQSSEYISPFSSQNRQQESPFNPIQPAVPQTATYFQQMNGHDQNIAKYGTKPRDPTEELLDNLFGPVSKPLDFSRPSATVPVQPVTPMVFEHSRPAATVLPMRRPDGTWSTESESNAILGFTNVQSLSHSENAEGRNSRAGI